VVSAGRRLLLATRLSNDFGMGDHHKTPSGDEVWLLALQEHGRSGSALRFQGTQGTQGPELCDGLRDDSAATCKQCLSSATLQLASNGEYYMV
jgi:hypothetical protein